MSQCVALPTLTFSWLFWEAVEHSKEFGSSVAEKLQDLASSQAGSWKYRVLQSPTVTRTLCSVACFVVCFKVLIFCLPTSEEDEAIVEQAAGSPWIQAALRSRCRWLLTWPKMLAWSLAPQDGKTRWLFVGHVTLFQLLQALLLSQRDYLTP